MKQVNFTTETMTSLIQSFEWKSFGLSFLLIGIGLKGVPQNIQWQENFGGSDDDEAKSIVQTSDGGFAIAGESQSSDGDVRMNKGAQDYWVVKLDNTGALQWEKNFGGSSSDEAKSIVQTSDGGFAIAGESISNTGDVGGNNGFDFYNDYWVIKLDSVGALQWEKNLGGSNSDIAYSIIQTSDEGFAIAGVSRSSDFDVGGNNGESDYWVVKLDNFGDLQWEKNLGGSDRDIAYSIIQTSDDGFAVVGESQSSDGDVGANNGSLGYWVVKLDNSGDLQWEKHLGGSKLDRARSIVQTSDGGFAIAGYSYSDNEDVGGNKGSSDYWIVKLDNSGTLQWEKNFGGSSSDEATSMVQTSDDGFAIAGYSESSDIDVGGNNGEGDYWVVKLDNTGNLQWEKNLGGNKDDIAESIVQTSDGGFTLAGISNSSVGDVGGNKGNDDYWVVKLGTGNQTGMLQNNQNAFFSIYPNPAQNQLQLQTLIQTQTYTLHTLTGQKAQSGKLSGKGTQTIDVSDLSPGVYLLEVQGEDTVRTKKVVVE